jgi:hypothetical protein
LKNRLNDWLRPDRAAALSWNRAAVFLRDRKFTPGFASTSHGRPMASYRVRKMPVQQRELRKNYIGLISDKTDEQYTVESQAKPDQRVKDYLRTLVAAVRNRRDAGQ